MTDSNTRPTPSLLAARRPAAPVTAAVALPVRSYDRRVWEQAVMRGGLHPVAGVLAFVLAHYAGDAGYLPPGEFQHPDRLGEVSGMTARQVRVSMDALRDAGLVSRPPLRGWDKTKHGGLRPITLTLPDERQEPAHTGGRP